MIGAFVICGGICVLAVFFVLPAQARVAFGPPAPGLSREQRFLLSARLLVNADQLTEPFDQDQPEKAFQVLMGDSPNTISGHLQAQGLIPNADALLNYLVYAGLDTTLQAGEYKLSAGLTPIEIAQALQDATPKEITFTILPGWRLDEVAEALPTSGLSITPDEFLEATRNPPTDAPIRGYLPPGATLEGFIPPGSYQLPRETNVDELVAYLTNSLIAQMDQELLDGYFNQGLDLYQAVTLASIVQREAVIEDEMPLIASVFANRLAAGMKLETDPTVQYALGYQASKRTWWKSPLSLDDLQVNSPYNTYLHPGLPPGPIANPSLAALRAVASPASTPYFYFRAACDNSGLHVFSETFEEHLNNQCP